MDAQFDDVQFEIVVAELLGQARRMLGSGRRHILGIAGPPAVTTVLSHRLDTALGDDCRVVAVAGFRLARTELERLGRAAGDPGSFDVEGYAGLLRRLRRQEDDVVYAPAFDESLGEAIAGAVPVPRRVPLIVTDGDHLLVEEGPWLMIGFLLDVVWRVELDLPAAHDGRPPMRRAQGRADRVVRLVPRPR